MMSVEPFLWDENSTLKDFENFLFVFESVLTVANINYTQLNHKLAISYLIPVCGKKMASFIKTLPNLAALTYGGLKTILLAKFGTTNVRYNTALFRACKQEPEEQLADYVTRLRMLIAHTDVAIEHQDDEICHQIAQFAYRQEVRAKAIQVDFTLTQILTWIKQVELSEQLERIVTKNGVVNRVTEQKPTGMLCFNCNRQYPHVFPQLCPAKDKECSKCHKLNHFAICCRSIAGRRRTSSNNNAGPYNNRSRERSSENNNNSNRNRSNQYQQYNQYYNGTQNQNNARTNTRPARGMHTYPHMDGRPPIIRPFTPRPFSNNDSNRQESQVQFADATYQSQEELEELQRRWLTENPDMNDARRYNNEALEYDRHNYYANAAYEINSANTAAPRVILAIGNTNVNHIIDTGANINVMPYASFCNLTHKPKLVRSAASIYTYNNKEVPLVTLGEFYIHLKFKNKTVLARYVVIANKTNTVPDTLLSFKTASDLGIIHIDQDLGQTNMVTEDDNWQSRLKTKYAPLFENRIGKLVGYQAELTLKPDVIPTQAVTYKIPFHLIGPTKEKLDQMLKDDIIEWVPPNTHVTWISAMCPVLKSERSPSGQIQVRITSDSKSLNKALITQQRHLPYALELTFDLTDCAFISVVDIKGL